MYLIRQTKKKIEDLKTSIDYATTLNKKVGTKFTMFVPTDDAWQKLFESMKGQSFEKPLLTLGSDSDDKEVYMSVWTNVSHNLFIESFETYL